MRSIVYYVATSIDGFIASPDEDISRFVAGDDLVNQYLTDLEEFDTVIMGRKTYEFGYKFGLEPGQLAYPHMKHVIFSRTLKFESPAKGLHVTGIDLNLIDELKREEGSDIYLCGGGEFAGWLLENEKIDILKIKLNPTILGEGVRLFGNCKTPVHLEQLNATQYDKGAQIITYKIIYE